MHRSFAPSERESAVNDCAARVAFSITEWAAWAPGLTDQAAWRAQFADLNSLWNGSDEAAPVPSLAPMTRRRLNRIGRSALQVARQRSAAALADLDALAIAYGEQTSRDATIGGLAEIQSALKEAEAIVNRQTARLETLNR